MQKTPEEWTAIYQQDDMKAKLEHNKFVFENMLVPNWQVNCNVR